MCVSVFHEFHRGSELTSSSDEEKLPIPNSVGHDGGSEFSPVTDHPGMYYKVKYIIVQYLHSQMSHCMI